MSELKLGLQLGYWGALYPAGHVDPAVEAEKLGYDSVWTAEAYGSDAVTPAAWILAQTEKILQMIEMYSRVRVSGLP